MVFTHILDRLCFLLRAFALVRFQFLSAAAVFDEIDVRVLFLFSVIPSEICVKNPKIFSHNEAGGKPEILRDRQL